MATRVQIYWLKPIDNSRLIRQRHPQRIRECWALLGVALVCLSVALLCAWQHYQFLHHGYQLEELRAQYAQLREWNHTLRLEQASLRDPMRIDTLARARLGLQAPSAGRWIPVGAPARLSEALVLARMNSNSASATRISVAD